MIIYLTTNLKNGKQYIGRDANNKPSYLGGGKLIREAVKKYGKENFKKEILEYCNSDEELHLKESYWIQKYNAVESDDFYNIIDFSAGWNLDKLGIHKYNFIIEKISKAKTGIKPNIKNWEQRNKLISLKTKNTPKPYGFGNKISEIKKGKKLSKDHCDKISKGKLGKNQPQSFSDKKYKPIIQMDLNNNYIKEFKSIDEAAGSDNKFKRSNISCCLNGFSKTAYGFKWVFK